MIGVYNNNPEISLTPRRQETIEKYNKIIQYGRRNPVWFIENILKIPLMDYQKYVIMGTWTAEEAVWLMGRGSGQSFLGGVYITARSLLYPNHRTYIMTGTADMSKETFSNIENIALKQVATLKNPSDVLINEVVKSSTNNGFTHDKQSHRCKFYNGSFVASLIGDEKQIVGKRCEVAYYDEAGKISQNFFDLTEPFTVIDADFQLGASIDTTLIPKNVPRQHLYTSSAEDVSSHLYQKYKECSKSMMMGLKNRFCVDFNCEIPMHPTINGKPTKPLLTQSVVDRAMEDNPYRATREYYNIFDKNGGTDCIVGRDVIRRNERMYLPVFGNEGKPNAHYGLFWDPAPKVDNSFVLIGEFIPDEQEGFRCRLVNGINMVNYLPNGEKSPMRYTDQVKYFRKLMVAYNGNAPDWENIHIFVDPGAGGQGSAILDELMEDFVDDNGVKHCGVIDMEDDFYKEMKPKVPNAKEGVIRAWSAQKFKNAMYESTESVLTKDLITFMVTPPRNKKLELEEGKMYTLTKEQLRAMLEIDLVKEEFLLMRKTKTENGNIRFALTPEKQRTASDDRAYTLAALSFYLFQLLRDERFKQKKNKQDLSILYKGAGTSQKKVSPFGGGTNPFGRKGATIGR